MAVLRDPQRGTIRFAGKALRVTPGGTVTPPPDGGAPSSAVVDSNGNGVTDSNSNYLTAS